MGDLNSRPYLYKRDNMSFDDENFGLDKNSELYRLLKMLNEREDLGEDHEDNEDDLARLAELATDQDALGEPHKIEVYKEGDLTITVKYWFVPGGEIKNVDIEGDDEKVSQQDLEDKIAQIIQENGDLNVIGVDINREPLVLGTTDPQVVSEKSMEQLLQEVVDREDYALAAKIRDDIKQRDVLIDATVAEAKSKIEEGKYDDAEILLGKAAELKKRGYSHGN